MDTTYKVIRIYQNEKIPSEVIEEGLTLKEAREICRDPETSSRTCSELENVKRTEIYGNWFLGYEEE